MSRPKPHGKRAQLSATDPRKVRNALLLDTVGVVSINHDHVGVGLMLGGRINRTPDRADVLVLLDGGGVAAVITELLALASRTGDPRADEVRRLVLERFTALDRDGDWGTP